MNLLRVLFDPDGLRPLTVNFARVARFLLHRLEQEIALRAGDEELEQLLAELEGYGSLPGSDREIERSAELDVDRPVLPIHLSRDGVDIRLFSVIMAVGAPRDVTVEELRVETFLPADRATDEYLRSASWDVRASDGKGAPTST